MRDKERFVRSMNRHSGPPTKGGARITLFTDLLPGVDPVAEVHALAAKAAENHKRNGHPVPLHVQAALTATQPSPVTEKTITLVVRRPTSLKVRAAIAAGLV